MSNAAEVIGTAKESETLMKAAKKRVQQCIGTAGAHREALISLRARLLGEHTDESPTDDAPEPVRSDCEDLFHQIDILQTQQELVGQHIEALQKL